MDDDRGIWTDERPSADIEGTLEAPPLMPVDDEVSRPFVGRWNGLVSETNWEKGRIICQWREALQSTGVPPTEYSDEAWSRHVGGVTGQHVGRLRRVFQRFSGTHSKYTGLYWSHFFAALEWDDAEMWLEGAVQNGWSVSETRRMRWQTMGEVDSERPVDEDEIQSELDEDFEPALRATPDSDRQSTEDVSGEADEIIEDDDQQLELEDADAELADDDQPTERQPRVRPFAGIPELPDDLANAFDAFKLAILSHRTRGWQEVAATDVIATLDALKALVLAPADDE